MGYRNGINPALFVYLITTLGKHVQYNRSGLQVISLFWLNIMHNEAEIVG